MVFYLEDSKDDARGNAKEKPPPKERRLKVLRPCQTTRKAGTDPISANLRVEPSEECDASVPR